MADVPEAQLDIIGDGDQRGTLERLVEDLDLAGRVTLKGSCDEVTLARSLRDCDVLCLPSIERTEAFGMVLLEAMSCGKPCLVTEVPGSGMAWVVENAKTGLTVPAISTPGLLHALKFLHSQRDTLEHLGEQGLERFNRLFHIDKSAIAVKDLYRQVLDAQATG